MMRAATRTTGMSGTAGWQVETLSGSALMRLSGEIDMSAVTDPPPGLLAQLLGAVEGAEGVACHLGDVVFMDSSGIHLLVKLQDELDAGGRTFKIVEPSARVQRVFDLINADQLFEIEGGSS